MMKKIAGTGTCSWKWVGKRWKRNRVKHKQTEHDKKKQLGREVDRWKWVVWRDERSRESVMFSLPKLAPFPRGIFFRALPFLPPLLPLPPHRDRYCYINVTLHQRTSTDSPGK
jgi:hypothetical protein